MPEIKFEKEKLDAMLAAVGAELADMLKAEQLELAKSATDDAPSESSEGSSGPTDPDGEVADEASAPAGDEAPVGEGSPAPEGSAPEAPPMEGSAPADPAMDPSAGAPPSPEELQAEYSKLDPESLKMHYLACKAALMATMGADQGMAPPGAEASAPGAGAPPPPAPAGPPAGAPPMPPEQSGAPMAMSEKKLVKSEQDLEIESLRAELKNTNEAMIKLAEVVAKPIRKSIKGLSDLKFIERSEEVKGPAAASLTKAEVTAKLREKVREGKLSKSDKDLVSKYTVGGVDVSKIEHLLADLK